MDFSILLSSGSLLYVGLGVIVLLIIILAALFKGKSSPSAVPTVSASTNVPADVETQAVTQPLEVLPSTEVVNQLPVTEPAPVVPMTEVPKAEVPPLSSWKPSQEAAPIPAKDDVTPVTAPASEPVEQKLA